MKTKKLWWSLMNIVSDSLRVLSYVFVTLYAMSTACDLPLNPAIPFGNTGLLGLTVIAGVLSIALKHVERNKP